MMERTGHPLSADEELWSLVEAMVDGTATAEEQERLQTRLQAEQQARLFYVAYLDLHAHLQWSMRGESVPRNGTARPEVPSQKPSPLRRILRSRLGGAVAAALVLAAGLLVIALVRHDELDEGEALDLPNSPPGSVAVLINNKNTVWEKDMALPTETGSALLPGKLKLKAGVAEIVFHAGGDVLLEGPADFDVSAPDQGYLHQGKLTAKVPGGAAALRVSMPGVVVTDRGGECGLLRNELGLTEVHVFAGRVDANTIDPEGEPTLGTRLAENAGARMDDSKGLTPVPLNERAFAHLRPDVRVTDAAVRAGQFSGRSFGTIPRLVVKNSIADYTWETYLCFDLSGIKGAVGLARMRLVPVRVGEPVVNAAALVNENEWGEATITWENKPPSGPVFAAWTPERGKPVEVDVTRRVQEALAGDKKLSLRIFAPNYKRGNSDVEYGSRKGEAETRPQLLIMTF
jgi:hypothetical protein